MQRAGQRWIVGLDGSYTRAEKYVCYWGSRMIPISEILVPQKSVSLISLDWFLLIPVVLTPSLSEPDDLVRTLFTSVLPANTCPFGNV